MSLAPLTVLLVAVGTLTFQALIFGNSLVEQSVIASVDVPSCQDDSGTLATIACWIRAIGLGIVNAVLLIASVVRFFYNAMTFNVPGAPALVRVLFTTFFIGSIGLMIASLSRGTKA